MDKWFDETFLQALKTSLQSEELPITGSVLYSLHMLPNRPKGSKLDLKNSSYKKLGKFLQSKAKEGLITCKSAGNGELQITKVNTDHQLYIEFEPYSVKKTSDNDPGNDNLDENKEYFKITKLYRPTGKLFDIFRCVNESSSKSDCYIRKDAVKILWDYVSMKELSKSGAKSVSLDSILASAIFKGQKNEGDSVSKEQLGTQFISALQENFHIARGHEEGNMMFVYLNFTLVV